MKKQLLTVITTMLLTLLLTGCGSYANGEKVGTIVKLEEKKHKLLFVTYEGELIRGGLNNGSGVMGQSFDFTISNPALLPIANVAMADNKEIKVKYHSDYFAPISSGNKNNNFVDSIEIINNDEHVK